MLRLIEKVCGQRASHDDGGGGDGGGAERKAQKGRGPTMLCKAAMRWVVEERRRNVDCPREESE
jgi:hypothetical protein